MKNCLIVFAKEPKKRRVKTRLNRLSEDERLNLYKAFLKDTVALAKSIKRNKRILAYDSKSHPVYLKKIARQFKFYKQKGNNLGIRMHNAFKFAQSSRATKTVIIGTDSPTLPVDFIKDAFYRLDKNDVVVGPSRDGGYYLIGLKKPCLSLFKGIKWSSATVLMNTITNAKKLKKKTAILNQWFDIDDSKSLIYLKHTLKKERNKHVAKWTRRFLKI